MCTESNKVTPPGRTRGPLTEEKRAEEALLSLREEGRGGLDPLSSKWGGLGDGLNKKNGCRRSGGERLCRGIGGRPMPQEGSKTTPTVSHGSVLGGTNQRETQGPPEKEGTETACAIEDKDNVEKYGESGGGKETSLRVI